jgi:hypothetical protein
MCGTKSCWKATRAGFKYTDRTGAADGLFGILLQAGKPGAARVVVKGGGSELHVPVVPLEVPIRVQLQNTAGECWETLFPVGQVKAHLDGSGGTVWDWTFRDLPTGN